MSDYFDFSTGRLSVGTTARSSEVNNLFDAIDTGLDKLPSETHLKRGLVNYAVAGGTENALTLTLPYAPSLYTDGMEVLFKAGYTNTLPATININSLGAKSIRRQDGTALVAGDIVLAKIFTLRYNSTSDYFEIQGSPVGSAGTGTMSTQNAAAVSITGGTMDDVTITSSEPITFNSHQDTDGDTKVQVEEGSDDDTIRFDTGGTERVTITTTKVTSNIPVQFNSHQDTDGDTKVQVEEGSDDDTIRFDTGGTERVVIDSSGLDVVSGSILKGGTDIRDTVETLTNKRLTSPKINEDVALSASATQLDTAATAVGNATATPTASRIAMYDANLRLKSGAAPSALTDVVRLDDFPTDTLHFLSNGNTAHAATVDWNNYTSAGFYWGDALTNSPPAIAASHTYLHMTVLVHIISSWVVQIARDLNGSAQWQRAFVYGTWGAWEIIWSKPITVALGGNFTSNISLARNGSVVTASWGILYHSLRYDPSSAAGVIPSLYRPAAAKTLLQRVMAVAFSTLNFSSAGTLSIIHKDYTGGNASTTQAEGGGTSWIV